MHLKRATSQSVTNELFKQRDFFPLILKCYDKTVF